MKDWFLNSALSKFKQEFSYGTLKDTDAFERFVNHCVISHTIKEELDSESVEMLSVGGQSDTGLDGIALLINNQLVTSIEDLESIVSYLDVKFVFVQSKTSDKFDNGDVLKFLQGVVGFLADDELHPDEGRIGDIKALKKALYEKYALRLANLKNPECHMYYATTGEWKDPEPIVRSIRSYEKQLQDLSIFSEIAFHPWDAQKLRAVYQEVTNRIDATLIMEQNTPVPVKGASEGTYRAWVGVVRCQELLDFVSDENNEMRSNLFDSNVRDYQGDSNKVNADMRSTLRDSDEKRSQFVLLNNGITIVAREVHQTEAFTFQLTDFQIVNGCQTTNVLWNNKDVVTDDMYVPVKLISTSDIELMNSIVMKTNSQTQILEENFAALAPYHQALEQYYDVMADEYLPRIYYERRSRQYERQQIPRNHCVTMSAQIKSYVGMFGEKPHAANRYFGQILAQENLNDPRLFRDSSRMIEHFVSGYALVILNGLFSEGIAPHRFRQFYLYHILMIFRVMQEATKGSVEQKCRGLMAILSDPIKSKKAFEASYRILDEALRNYPAGRGRDGNPAGQLATFTQQIRSLAEERRIITKVDAADRKDRDDSVSIPKSKMHETGKVISANNMWAYIENSNGEKFYANGYSIREGQIVEFDIEENSQGPNRRAVQVEVVG